MKKTILVLLVLMISLVSAVTLEMNLSQETKEVLSRVGKGIGTIEKIIEVYINETYYYNETYIDTLKLINGDCSNGYCYFTLYENGGIYKEFKIELEKICAKEGICIEEGEEYECCLIWRAETDEEVLIKAEAKTEEILNHIADVTLDREARNKVKRFEDSIELTI